MTIIVGAVKDGIVAMGADSLAVTSSNAKIYVDDKVVRKQVRISSGYQTTSPVDILIGECGSLSATPKLDTAGSFSSIGAYLDHLAHEMKDIASQLADQDGYAGSLLVGACGKLYIVSDNGRWYDYHHRTDDGWVYQAIGSADTVAMGAIHGQLSADPKLSLTEVVLGAVSAAIAIDANCGGSASVSVIQPCGR